MAYYSVQRGNKVTYGLLKAQFSANWRQVEAISCVKIIDTHFCQSFSPLSLVYHSLIQITRLVHNTITALYFLSFLSVLDKQNRHPAVILFHIWLINLALFLRKKK